MAVLELKRISKHFGAIEALSQRRFRTRAAARSSGSWATTAPANRRWSRSSPATSRRRAARCCWKARPVHFHKPVDARAAGIEVVYQDLALCNNLTASANVFLAREKKRGFGPFRILDDRAMNERSRELFAELKSETRPAETVRMMSGGQRQAVAIARTHLSQGQDRPDGRADGGDQRAPGGGGARPPAAVARAGHGGGADQPPHARRLRASPTASSCCGAATRLPTSRSRTARRRR